MQAGSTAPATISKPQENQPISNYQVTPFNTVNMEEFGKIIGGTYSDNPSSTVINHNLPNTFPAQNSSTSVAIYQPIAPEPETELVLEEATESGGSNTTTMPQEQNPAPPTIMGNDSNIQANEEVMNTLKQSNEQVPEAPPSEYDTPSPIQFQEGQIYILNNSMQFVKFHGTIGDKYVITNKGLQKLDDEEQSTPQVLTLKGRFSFKFESN
jgi:hypothetical protein